MNPYDRRLPYCTYISFPVNEFAHSVDPSGERIDGKHVSEVALHDGVLWSVHICNVSIID